HPVPQREPETEGLVLVAYGGEPVLTPPVRPRPRVLVREVVPGAAVGAVVLPYGAPGPLRHVRPPRAPRLRAGVGRGQPIALRRHSSRTTFTSSGPPAKAFA